MPPVARILLISGSLRGASTNSALLRTAQEVAPDGVETVLYSGMDSLPHFNPDDDAEGLPVVDSVAELRAAIGGADAVLVSTPEYAGALPGSFKNLLEWTIGAAALSRKPVAWVNVSARGPQGGVNAHESLRKVLGFADAEVVEQACAHIPVTHGAVTGEDATIADDEIRTRLAEVLSTLAAHVAATPAA